MLYPVAWAMPLMRAGLLPLFGLEEISILTGPARALGRGRGSRSAILVALFALVAPILKTLCLTLVHLSRAPPGSCPRCSFWASSPWPMSSLIAVYVTLAKGLCRGPRGNGMGVSGFSTACVLGSLAIGHLTQRQLKERSA